MIKINPETTFHTIARHLLKQGRRSLLGDGPTCAYLAEDGAKCAVGCLIPEDEYDSMIDYGKGARVEAVIVRCPSLQDHSRDILRQMQRLHDRIDPEKWDVALETFAVVNGFKWPLPPEDQ